MSTSYKNALAAQAAAAAAAAASSSSGSSGSSGIGGQRVRSSPNASAAQVAIAAAESVIGTTYVFGSADPGVGFDCSGLVMWSYAPGRASRFRTPRR